MKVIPETIELDESDILAAILIYLDEMGHGNNFDIKLHTESKQFPNPHMTGGMADWSERVLISATATRK